MIVNNRRREVDAAGRGSADRVVEEIIAAAATRAPTTRTSAARARATRLVRQALDTWGRLDVLVNNAGVDQHAAFHQHRPGDVPCDLRSQFLRHRAGDPCGLGRTCASAGHGRVLVSTSSAGLHGLHGLSAYASSKAALIGLARSLAAEGASRDLYCNAIAPYAATRMTAAHVDGRRRRSRNDARTRRAAGSALVSAHSRDQRPGDRRGPGLGAPQQRRWKWTRATSSVRGRQSDASTQLTSRATALRGCVPRVPRRAGVVRRLSRLLLSGACDNVDRGVAYTPVYLSKRPERCHGRNAHSAQHRSGRGGL